MCPVDHCTRHRRAWESLKDWRAHGLVIGRPPADGEVETRARERGLLVNAVRPDVLRLAPPLIVTEADVDEALPILREALDG